MDTGFNARSTVLLSNSRKPLSRQSQVFDIPPRAYRIALARGDLPEILGKQGYVGDTSEFNSSQVGLQSDLSNNPYMHKLLVRVKRECQAG
jgi:hypothetical protein